MSQVTASDYHFCTLNQLQSPKQLPSLDFVTKILNICHVPITLFESPQRNIYDRKNHILYINNYESYARTLKEKYGRSVASFEKQLKMMGFKKRKIKQHLSQSYTDIKIEPASQAQGFTFNQDLKEDGMHYQGRKEGTGEQQRNNRIFNSQSCEIKKQKDHPIKYMFVWRTNRSALIDKEFESLEQALSEEVQKAISMKQEMEMRKKELDSKLETIIFHSLLNCHENSFSEMQTQAPVVTLKKLNKNQKSETILERCLNEALKQLKILSNESQIQSRDVIRTISQNAEKELELFRILIYKETQIHKAIEEQ